ncbi:unnamed protein product [Oncorhynchus mykiss]|uniref:Uncharacterized protein n=1 Tax=Oncorhynchus mykiss TaxID=8022 RepID=A0A060XM97_ONCMY|nr:unnamed protein product [Oncorhynchus mykiss]
MNNVSSNQRKRAAVLHGLPYLLREDLTYFLKTYEKTTDSEEVPRGVKIGILVVVDGAAADDPMLADNVDVALVIEEQVITHELHNVPNAFATLIGLLYCLNMDYPKCLRYTFEVVQKMLLKIGAEN